MTDTVNLTPYSRALRPSFWHKMRVRITRPLGLAERFGNLSEPERIALRNRTRKTGWTTSPKVIFATAVIGKAKARDWKRVNSLLAATAVSVLNQTDPHWIWLVTGQDMPDLPDDPRVFWVPWNKSMEGHDQSPKMVDLVDQFPELNIPEGILVPLDGDDLISKHLVADMRALPPSGALFEKGYMYDAETRQVALTDRPGLGDLRNRPLYKNCGTCIALPYQPGSADIEVLRAIMWLSHRHFAWYARLYGLSLPPAKRPLAVYMLGHGQNALLRRGRGGFKRRFIERRAITDPDERARIAEEFALQL
ncbi:hypothetical protein [Shimia ponticola]|uniref:hypothetical protein n=1 Tax=Shimia ponticola TaxID=2582893 RepID=UPI0011BF7BE4|nr:hypothetical protein [Shimia ponticola]